MIVEIHGVNQAKMEEVKIKLLLWRGLFDLTAIEGWDKKIHVNADTGSAKLICASRLVWGRDDIRVFFGEPDISSITIECSLHLLGGVMEACLNKEIFKKQKEQIYNIVEKVQKESTTG